MKAIQVLTRSRMLAQEKEIARMVTLAFGQKVCGFDLLRSDRARSFVCDVNGWSFVKSSTKVPITSHPNLQLNEPVPKFDMPDVHVSSQSLSEAFAFVAAAHPK